VENILDLVLSDVKERFDSRRRSTETSLIVRDHMPGPVADFTTFSSLLPGSPLRRRSRIP